MHILQKYISQFLFIILPLTICGIGSMFYVNNVYYTAVCTVILLFVAFALLPILIIKDVKDKWKIIHSYQNYKQGLLSKTEFMQELVSQLTSISSQSTLKEMSQTQLNPKHTISSAKSKNMSTKNQSALIQKMIARSK